jgi:hypothetical protein
VSPADLYHLMPLQFFYAREGMALPEIRFIEGDEMPEPEKSLLVHETDMTPRLSEYHEAELGIRVLEKELNDDYLLRLVVLETLDGGKVVEFGAIGIHVDAFPERVRGMIRDCRRPLGGILKDEGVAHRGKPGAYFEVRADRRISQALREPVGARLFGRCNQLRDNDGMALADIVEILPSRGQARDPHGA